MNIPLSPFRSLSASHAEELRALHAQLAEAGQEKEELRTQLAVLQCDASRFQQTAKQAFANYERELQLHALAERSLKDSQEALETARHSHSEAEHRAASLSSDLIRLEKLRDEDQQVPLPSFMPLFQYRYFYYIKYKY